MNITLDDTSPLFQYVSADPAAAWLRDSATHSDDPKIGQYYRSTMTKTTGQGNYVSLSFNGSAVYIYGAKRVNHGAYSDNESPTMFQGYADRPGAMQTLLYSAVDLATDRVHSVQVTNLPSQPNDTVRVKGPLWSDIDYAIVTAQPYPDPAAPVYTTEIDDTSSACQYEGNAWSYQPMNPGEYFNSTAHITQNNQDAVTCNFTGTAVEVIGGLMTDHDNYTVSLDEGPPMPFNGSYHTIFTRATLFVASQLDDGPHTIRLTNIHQDMFMDIDYLVVNSTVAPPAVSGGSIPNTVLATPIPTANPGSSPAPHAATALSLAALVGITVGIVFGIALLISSTCAAWRWLGRRKQWGHPRALSKTSEIDLAGDEVRPFTQVSPITIDYDTYSPAFVGFPTPLRLGTAFFPYDPASPASSPSHVAESSLGRNRALAVGAHKDLFSESHSSDGGGFASQPSDACTFGIQPPQLPPPVMSSSISRSSRTGRMSFESSLMRLYRHGASSVTEESTVSTRADVSGANINVEEGGKGKQD